MIKKAKIFKNFYSKNRNDVLDIVLVENYANSHDGDIGSFQNDMFCPECKQAELTFVHKSTTRRAHLRRIKSTKHKDGCSYNYEYALKNVISKYVDSLNYDEIQDKLNSIMNILCRKPCERKTLIDETMSKGKKEQNLTLISKKKGDENILRVLCRKSLNAWIDESNGEDLYVFYGRVKLKVEEKEKKVDDLKHSYKYHLLNIYTQNKKDGEWKFRTRLYRGNITDSVKEDEIYNIVMIGNLNFDYKPFTIKLVNQYAIKYREI